MAMNPTSNPSLRSAGSGVVSAVGEAGETVEASRSAVSWAAIFAGAAAATATSLLLLTLGSGIGLSSVSPWQNSGATATTFAVGAAVWLIIVQWLASALGGYLTGRLRTKWVSTHNDEVFFRDTAHGFVTWSVATLFGAMVLASVGSSLISGGVSAVTGIAGGAAQGASQAASTSASSLDPSAFLVDTLFRPTTPNADGASAADAKSEATRILVTSVRNGSLAPADKTYLAQLAAARTGISQQDAEKRVDDMMAQAKAAADKAREAADQARKSASRLAFFTFFSMLIGAFIASAAAALGGRQRDEW